jgi:hypothetical protein
MEGNHMTYYVLLFLIIGINICAVEDYPAIIASNPYSPSLLMEKRNKNIVILSHVNELGQAIDFYASPSVLQNTIEKSIQDRAIMEHMLENHTCTDDIKEKFKHHLKWFYPHHANLMIWAVNNAVYTGDESFIDLFVALVKIPTLMSKHISWLEIDKEQHCKEIIGKISDYIKIYQYQIKESKLEGAQESNNILQELLEKVSPPNFAAEPAM